MSTLSSFIPSEDVRRLTSGSYEQLKAQVEESVNGARERLFSSPASISVVGTFSGYAIVLSEDARVFRVKYEKAESGEIVPLMSEELSVAAYTPATMDKFVKRESLAYVEAFMGGSRSMATEHLKNLIPFMKDHAVPVEPPKLVESFDSLVKFPRTWKNIYAERLPQIRSSIKDELPKLEEGRLHEKFHRLYDGSVLESEKAGYKELVTSDLKYLGEKVESLLSETEKSVNMFKGAVPALKEEQKDSTVKMFESFTEDFVADLKGVRKALSEASDHLISVDDFGKIYDSLANELYRFEVAGKFISTMSSRLSKAAEEG